MMETESGKMEKFLEHFGKEIDGFIKEFGDKIFV